MLNTTELHTKISYWNITMILMWRIPDRTIRYHRMTMFVFFFKFPFVCKRLFNIFFNCFSLLQSTWKQYFKDIELKKIIQQDVVRTSPGVEFFRTEKIQKTMIDILFFYSREHSDLSYRQVSNFLVYFFILE